MDQYRFDRIPKPKGKPFAEPLLDFPRGALVHFAVSNRTVMMATAARARHALFCPSTRATTAVRATRPTPGHRTAYLWEQVWQRDSWLEIMGATRHPARQQEEGDGLHLPALPPARCHAQAAGRRAGRGLGINT